MNAFYPISISATLLSKQPEIYKFRKILRGERKTDKGKQKISKRQI